ncbi:uncharacterized protein LOC110018700 isoform X3 [Phalaenopsis equestris]|uniref:uncharacterized protein LOC110018700 isoform X3 n=1 Tax=Phalaenopsis equestris TaxID=78828 RepID=UPI0009E2FCFA|nr:uncharacterized protein LOC110018700 isoform X3 [Phalaenopsis equestris]
MALPTPASTLNILSPQSSSPTSTRAAVILPGLGNNSGDYRSLCRTLTDGYGIPTAVAKVSRFDWLRNAAGLVDSNYWRGTLSPRPVLNWYLERVVAAVAEAKKLCSEGGRIALIGHSAGGWLARVYMKEFGWSDISLLLTLGTPHLYIRGAQFISNLDSNIIAQVDDDRGASVLVKKEGTVKSTPVAPTMRARFIGQGYKQVCGKADVWGDGVVPEMSAHLDGALNISLDGVYHSPVGSDELLRPWYGSPSVVQQWIAHLLN